MTRLLKSKNGHKGSLRPTTRVFFHAFPMCFFGFLHVFLHCVHFCHPRALQPRVFFFIGFFFHPHVATLFSFFTSASPPLSRLTSHLSSSKTLPISSIFKLSMFSQQSVSPPIVNILPFLTSNCGVLRHVHHTCLRPDNHLSQAS